MYEIIIIFYAQNTFLGAVSMTYLRASTILCLALHDFPKARREGCLCLLQGMYTPAYNKYYFITFKSIILECFSRPCPGYLTESILEHGKFLKEMDIALDVVSFAHKDQEFDALKTKCLRSFVAAANNKDNNSHFARVPRDSSSVCDILVRFVPTF